MKIFGKENFKKDIIKHFETREKASEYEALMVTEKLVYDKNCYNIKCGGDYGTTCGTILVRNQENKVIRVPLNDERYINGELVPFMKNRVPVFDKKDKKYKIIEEDEFSKNKDRYISHNKGHITAKDKNGNVLYISINDERYINGELIPIWTGRHHSESTKIKISETHKRNHHQQGVKNSSYGTCWITKEEKNKKINRNLLKEYEKDGWKLGRYVDDSQKKYKTDSLDKNKVIALYQELKNWKKVALTLGIDKVTLLRYRRREKIIV